LEGTDKIILDLEPEFIGKIDLLVEKNLYKSRVDFIEKSILSQLSAHTSTIEEYQKKKDFVVGVVSYSVKELENVIKEGKKLHIRVIGALHLRKDVTPELANQAIKEINLAGIFRASSDVKKILAPKRLSITGKKHNYYDKNQLTDKSDS